MEEIQLIADTTAPKNADKCGDDHGLALWFTPDAIRDHYEGADEAEAERVNAMSDEELRAVAEECLSGDIIYKAFCDSLDLALEFKDYA